MSGLYSFRPPRDAFPRARLAVLRALELDESYLWAHANLAKISLFYDWDWGAAAEHFRRADELADEIKTTSLPWGREFLLTSVGRFDEAMAQSQAILDGDPLALSDHARHWVLLFLARRFPEVVKRCEATLELNPNHSEAYRLMGHAYEMLGRLDDSREAFERAVILSQRHPWALSGLARALIRLGRHDEASAHVGALEPGVASGSVLPTILANIYAVSNGDAAFEWLERAVEERDWTLAFLRVNPLLDGLRGDPRFDRLIERVGIPPLASA